MSLAGWRRSPAVDNPRFVSASGIRTRYFDAGAKEPLVLLHGSTFGEVSNAEGWEPVFDRLAAGFHVYAVDKIGQGFTDNPKSDSEYVIGTTVKHVFDFAQALGLTGLHVVGHSRGAYTACRLAIEHAQLVKTLVIVDSSTLMSHDLPFYAKLEAELAGIDDVKEHYRYMLRAHSWRGDHITEKWLNGMIDIHSLPKTRVAAAKMGWGALSGGGSSFRVKEPIGQAFFDDLYARQKETHEWIRGGALRVPTLIVWGFNDPSSPLDPTGLDTMRLIFPHTPRCEMHVLNEAGHNSFREQPEAFVAAVTSFIETTRRG
jgi:pimeloyl-ACP methyl ester carboxylesterase